MALNKAAKDLIEALDELGCPYCWRKRSGEQGSRVEQALEAVRQALATETQSTRRTFGKRREGQDRSTLAYPGLSSDPTPTPED